MNLTHLLLCVSPVTCNLAKQSLKKFEENIEPSQDTRDEKEFHLLS